MKFAVYKQYGPLHYIFTITLNPKRIGLTAHNYNKTPIINAVDITLKSLTPFFDLLDTKDLDGLFKTLHNHPTNSSDNKYKHKIKESDNNKNWLRLYALKISRGTYIVTGGAIKLWKDMDMDVATRTELQKMQMVADYLKEESITDKDSLEAYVFENGLL